MGGPLRCRVLGVTVGLVVADILDSGMRAWWVDHPFTTAVVTGLLVLLMTVLIADRGLERRRLKDRARVIAAQASLIYGQAVRTCEAVQPALRGTDAVDQDTEDAASEQMRTYAMSLMIAVPTLIDATMTRAFLEKAQGLAATVASELTPQPDGLSRVDCGRG